MLNGSEILIVDDMPDHIAFEGTILKSEGYTVYAVTSGKLALKFLESKHPDLIILDIKMESMDGLEVCKRVKSNPLTKDIPIIFLTSERDPKTIKKGFELGCCDYVTKPFIREEYLARVHTHLRISQQNRQLNDAYNELKMFCSAVSHDLKSPLNVINMLLDTLQSELGESQTQEVTEIVSMITDKSSQLIVMIERLLEFSKMCNITPKVETLNLENTIRETFQELILLEPNRHIELVCNELPTVFGDSVLIKTLIKNVISNAIKFTRNEPTAVVTVESIPDEDYTIITISDNGAGFDMAYADKLFKVFQRLHLSSEFAGSGVGLALVDRIMKRHNGKVTAYGEVDHGAKISLYFPKSFKLPID